MEKLCKKCNTVLTLGVNWRESNQRTSTYKCNECIKAYMSKWQKVNRDKMNSYSSKWRSDVDVQETLNNKSRQYLHSKKDGEYKVYLLTEENYVGQTNNMFRRLMEHRSNGRNTDNYRILHSTPNREEALELEALLHSMGYEGAFSR